MLKPLRMALGAMLIQTQYQYSDAEVPLQIQKTPCLQCFYGMPDSLYYFLFATTIQITHILENVFCSIGFN